MSSSSKTKNLKVNWKSTIKYSGAETHSPVPSFLPSTPVAVGTGPDYRACTSLGGFQDSRTKTGGHTRSCRSPREPHCRRWDAGGSLDHSWLSTGGERIFTLHSWSNISAHIGSLLTSDHSPVIQINSQACVLQLSMSGGLIWFMQYISWTSCWL